MTFDEAQAYLLSTLDETRSPRVPYRLEKMRAFLRELGDPQNAYPTVHVGGTSGKGSTSTMIAAILRAAGNRTGLHTKPHLRSITERARIDGADVSRERFAQLLDEMMPAIERTAAAFGRPSYYETLLALAFLHFARERVDVAVIEVGLGGRLDGTNVIVPQVSVITTIGYDHMDVLGNTLGAIAAEKAGIAKRGVPLVSAVADAGARRVIEAHCAQAGAPFISVLDTARVESLPAHGYAQRCAIETPEARYDVRLPLLGAFQRSNAATAIRAAEQLRGALRPNAAAIERGLAKVALAGRMEYLPGRPGVVFDVAHNQEKAQHLTAALREHFPGRRVRYVVAIGESKDAREIVRALSALPESAFVFTSFATTGRTAAAPERLVRLAAELHVRSRVARDPVGAFELARVGATPQDLIVVTGSTFVVADLRDWWFEHRVREAAAR